MGQCLGKSVSQSVITQLQKCSCARRRFPEKSTFKILALPKCFWEVADFIRSIYRRRRGGKRNSKNSRSSMRSKRSMRSRGCSAAAVTQCFP